nr:hypothetical protein CFP56_75024 [Quercus suber]
MEKRGGVKGGEKAYGYAVKQDYELGLAASGYNSTKSGAMGVGHFGSISLTQSAIRSKQNWKFLIHSISKNEKSCCWHCQHHLNYLIFAIIKRR